MHRCGDEDGLVVVVVSVLLVVFYHNQFILVYAALPMGL
jgi:hypothetical protein